MASAELEFLQDLAVVAGVAALTSILFQRIRFPLVFGLLTAGVIIGPHTPPFSLVQNEQSLQVLANLGIVLLLFGLGLEFNLRGLRRFGFAAAAITLAEVVLMFFLGYEVARFLGWSVLDSAFIGAMLSISSTAIIVAVLREMGRLEAESSRLLFAVLVLEDVAAIIILVLLSGYTATGDLPLQEAGLVLARMGVFLLAFLILGLLAIPKILDWVAKGFRSEVLVLTVLGLALGGALLSDFAGFHVGLGAFLTGALCAEAKKKSLIEDRFRPIHDLFAAIFFVAIGTLVDFSILATHWYTVLLLTAAIILGKTISGGLAAFLSGFSPRTSFAVGSALAQIGEFSFVIAALGLSTGAMNPVLFPIIVGAAAVTSFTSPLMIRSSDTVARTLGRLVPLPFRTYAAVYESFLRSWRTRPRGQQPAALLRERRYAFGSGSLLLVAWMAALVFQGPGNRLLTERGFGPAVSTLLYWGFWSVILIPSLYEFNRHVGGWLQAVHVARGGGKGPERIGARGVVRATIYLGVSLLVGLPVLIATGPFVTGIEAAIVWALIVLSVTLLLWRGILRLHHRVSEDVGRLLEGGDANQVPQVLEALFSQDFPADFKVATVPLPASSIWVERRVAETQLRTTTGASILLVERADGRQFPPRPDTLLLPNDRITLLGAPAQLESARSVLERQRDPDSARAPLHPGKLYVTENSTMDGRLLVESGLSERHGLQVVAIQREDEVLTNPTPQERLRAGDVLIVLGTRVQIFAAAEDLSRSSPSRTAA